MPLTTLQRQWLKALLSDPRIQLFNPDVEGVEDVETLFERDTFVDESRITTELITLLEKIDIPKFDMENCQKKHQIGFLVR